MLRRAHQWYSGSTLFSMLTELLWKVFSEKTLGLGGFGLEIWTFCRGVQHYPLILGKKHNLVHLEKSSYLIRVSLTGQG